jgi:transposase
VALRLGGAAPGRRDLHLAEPAETAERRGRKKRAKTDRADARLLRELVMVDRLPESWITPDHILDLRARVRLRHTLVDERGEWQQRIHAVLYHHGCPHHHGIGLLTAKGRAWLDSLGCRRQRASRSRSRLRGSVRPSVCEVGAGGLCVQSGIRLPKWILNARIAAGQL